MESIAIIGTGIAGMACGHYLHEKYDIKLFEKNNYVGGHTNTLTIDEDGEDIRIDSGFIVYNEATYPNLTRLFKELNVETKPTSMSFSVQHVPSGLEFSGTGINGLFSQRKNIFNLKFIRLLTEINQFNNESIEILEDPKYEEYTLLDYASEKKFSEDFLIKYLIPMSSAVWSTQPELMLKFPAVTLVRFFKNHGFMGLNTQHQWRTVVNGSQAYREKLIKPFKNHIVINSQIEKVISEENKVRIITMSNEVLEFDKVIIASHADQALAMLYNPTEMQIKLLKNFKYQRNTATLHRDSSVMPKAKRAWSSWNYRLDEINGLLKPSTIYYMNSLQQVSDKTDYFISIDDPGLVDKNKIIKIIEYEHPIFSINAIKSQKDLSELNNNGRIYFCGSYFNYGFHEDALKSAFNLCKKLLKQKERILV